jgi:hypothetical protein
MFLRVFGFHKGFLVTDVLGLVELSITPCDTEECNDRLRGRYSLSSAGRPALSLPYKVTSLGYCNVVVVLVLALPNAIYLCR